MESLVKHVREQVAADAAAAARLDIPSVSTAPFDNFPDQLELSGEPANSSRPAVAWKVSVDGHVSDVLSGSNASLDEADDGLQRKVRNIIYK